MYFNFRYVTFTNKNLNDKGLSRCEITNKSLL